MRSIYLSKITLKIAENFNRKQGIDQININIFHYVNILCFQNLVLLVRMNSNNHLAAKIPLIPDKY